MKNAHIERLRRQAKETHRHAAEAYGLDGVAQIYEFRAEPTWWTDTAFVLNDYRVAVAFVHPRMVYEDKVEELALERVAHLYTDRWAGDLTPRYVKVGRSRKKIVGYVRQSRSANDPWLSALDAEEDRLRTEADFVIAPFLHSHWTRHSRFVKFCAPLEIRNEQDLIGVAHLAKRLLKRETTLDAEFPGYVFTRSDWLSSQRRIE
jgi:hypothetical protein